MDGSVVEGCTGGENEVAGFVCEGKGTVMHLVQAESKFDGSGCCALNSGSV